MSRIGKQPIAIPAGVDVTIGANNEITVKGPKGTLVQTMSADMIIKKDGRREAFDRNKIMSGIVRACEKRPVPVAEMDRVVNEIERGLNNMMEKEVESTFVGELVMEKLKELDEVAYVRFASVYRQFTDVNTFVKEIEKLLGNK